ncbi:MAG: hypothetical protein A2711_06735 [Burkholderiales bacterium RIFCSPHIGHO2_01_FULL_63_240]|nr:MAG: hypothetical protein A2711_06735 [Burkholderiales bacterium RIFCSPHIGHO2_01_FULL_63_240]
MGWLESMSAAQTGLVVAFGAGLLIGVERERRKGQGPDRHSAGLRTFLVAALAGAAGQVLSPVVATVVLAAVSGLAGLSYWRSRSDDPGLTTELALIATTLIGMLAVSQPEVAAALAVVLAGVLALKTRLHHFATDWLSEAELHDGLLLAALALVLLPLLPAEPIAWLGHLSPRRVLMLVLVILLMQAASHLGQRLLGARAGVPMTGLLGGFVSSTATISALGSQARSGEVPLRLAWCGGVLSTAATWLQAWLIGGVLAPRHVSEMAGVALVGAAVPGLIGLALWRRQVAGERVQARVDGPVLRLKEALQVSALLVVGAMLVQWAHARSDAGLLIGVGLAAIADAHAPVAALWGMRDAGGLSANELLHGTLVAISVNAGTRTIAAWAAGGARYAAGIGAALGLSLAVVWGWDAFLS